MNSRWCLLSGVLWTIGKRWGLVFNNPACHHQSKSHQAEWKGTGRHEEPGDCLQPSESCPKQFTKLSPSLFMSHTAHCHIFQFGCGAFFSFSSQICWRQQKIERVRMFWLFCLKKWSGRLTSQTLFTSCLVKELTFGCSQPTIIYKHILFMY